MKIVAPGARGLARLAAGLLAGALACRPAPGTAERRPEATGAAGAGGIGVGIEDDLRRTVVPRALPARRVVSLAPNVTELLFALGAGAQVVGLDTYSDHPRPQVDRIPRVGSDYTPSLEKVAELAPDVVILSATANRRETIDDLQALAIPTFVTDTRSLADMDRLWRNLGLITGHAREAEDELRRQHAGLEAVRARAAGGARPAVLIVVWAEPLYVAGGRTFVDELIEIAGGRNVARAVTGFVRYPLEEVLKVEPEVIVIPTHALAFHGADAVAYWQRWPTLPAVRRHRVHAVEDAIISRPGARLVEGAEMLRALFHPAPPAAR